MSLRKVLSHHDAVYLLQLIQESLCCKKEDELICLINKLKHLISYEFAISGLGISDNRNQIKKYEIVNINYPCEWLDIYITKRYSNVDPIVKENYCSFSVQYWADTYKKRSYPKDFLHTANDFGLKQGYTHGILDKNRKGSLFSFSGSALNRDIRSEAVLEHIVPHLHNAMGRVLMNTPCAKDKTLSGRESEVLNWIKAGKTSWEISVILNISERTVNFHISNIKHKLDAVSRGHAVAVALENGLIDID